MPAFSVIRPYSLSPFAARVLTWKINVRFGTAHPWRHPLGPPLAATGSYNPNNAITLHEALPGRDFAKQKPIGSWQTWSISTPGAPP